MVVSLWLLVFAGLAQAQLTIVTHQPSCQADCLNHVKDDPVFDYNEEKCGSPRVSGTDYPSDYNQKLTSYQRCHCSIPGMLQREACCMVDSCYGEDGFFSFDCGVSITWVQCGRGRDTEVFTGLTTSGVSGGASTATASIDPEASDPAAPSTGQSVAGPDETGNADESENDRDSGGGNSNAKTIGLGVGLGVGIPLVLIGAGVLGFCVWRTKRQTGNQYSPTPYCGASNPRQMDIATHFRLRERDRAEAYE